MQTPLHRRTLSKADIFQSLSERINTASPFVSSTVLTAATNVLLAAVGMVSGILAARLLGPHGRGELAAIQTGPSFIATLAMLGMPEAIVYYSAREPIEAGRYLGSAMAISVLSSVPFMLLGYIAMPVMLHAQEPTVVWGGRWYLLIALVYVATVIPLSSLRGRADFLTWNAMRLSPQVVWILVLAITWKCGNTVPTLVAAAYLVGLGILVVPFAGVVRKRLSGSFLPERRKCVAMLQYGLPCMMTSVPQTMNLRLDQVLMAALLRPGALGLYVVAVAWSGATAPLLTAVAAVTTPAVASAVNDSHAAQRFAAAVRVTAALAIALCVSLVIMTPVAIVLLFGERFRASIPAAIVLMPAAGVLGLNLVLEEGLRGMGRPYSVLRAEVAGLVVTAIALAAMLRPLGIMGAAIASLLGYSTVLAVLLIKARRYFGVSVRELLLPSVQEIRLAIEQLFSRFRGIQIETSD